MWTWFYGCEKFNDWGLISMCAGVRCNWKFFDDGVIPDWSFRWHNFWYIILDK